MSFRGTRPRIQKRQAMNVNLKKLNIGELKPRMSARSCAKWARR